MDSYEKDMRGKIKKKEVLPEKLDINILKFFWQVNPLSKGSEDTIPRFLRSIDVFNNFSENDLRIFSKYLHMRVFAAEETIFEQGDMGVGFYLVFSGHVEIIAEDIYSNFLNRDLPDDDHRALHETMPIASLIKGDYFGELALLHHNTIRSASAKAQDSSILLGIFKPDLEELISNHPVVASKLLQAVSVIVANRLVSLTKEMRILRYKIGQMDKNESTD